MTATLNTSRVWQVSFGLDGGPVSAATGRNTPSFVSKPIPLPVRATIPAGIVYDSVGSQFVQRSVPFALVWTTRWPVASNSPDAVKSWLRRVAGTTPPAGSIEVASGSARTTNSTGPTGTGTGVTTTLAAGRMR